MVDGPGGEYDEAEDYSTPMSNGGRCSPSWNELTPAVPMLGEGLRRLALGDTVTASIASSSTPIMTPVPGPTGSVALTRSIPSALTPTAAPPAHDANHRARAFLGDFSDFYHASLKLKVPATWLVGMYVDGVLSISGRFAATRTGIGEEMYLMCASRTVLDHAVRQAVCRVLAEEDPARSALAKEYQGIEARCGFCLLAGTGCILGR